MSSLSVYHVSSPELPDKVLGHAEDIASTLAERGVGFERWPVGPAIGAGASQAEVLAACQHELERMRGARGLAPVEVLSLDRDHPQKAQLRAATLDEHRHGEEELCWLVAGRGLLSLHIDDYVYALLCEKNDLVRVPAGIARWFDIGEEPRLIAIHLSSSGQDRQARLSGDSIASRFPRLDD